MTKTAAYRSYQSLYFNGVKYFGEGELLSLAKQLMSDSDVEKQHIGHFISDWINGEEYIELQTSGSTGTPKVINVKKEAMVASAKRTIEFFQLPPEASALLCLSAKYIAGKMMLVRAMVGQLRLITSSVNSNPLKSIHGNIDFAAMVPMQVSTILKDNKESISKVHHLIIGGGNVNIHVSSKLKGLKTNAWETYGMTETVSHIALRNIQDEHASFVVLPGLIVSQDQRSCLVVEPSDINEHRLITNDIVEFNNDNAFILKGRYDNIINTGGVKLMPEAIERKLNAIISTPFAISWKQDSVLGQKIVLVCESKQSVSLDNISSNLLTKFEFPKEVIYIDEIPRTETGKIQRRKLQQLIDK